MRDERNPYETKRQSSLALGLQFRPKERLALLRPQVLHEPKLVFDPLIELFLVIGIVCEGRLGCLPR
jgi:hypothetical protein